MNMKDSKKIMTTGKGIHARRRVSIAAKQPLKPTFSARRAAILVLMLCVSLSLYAQQNLAEISRFINRPVTKIRTDAQWQQLNEAEVSRMLAGTMGKGFFDIDVASIKAKLEQNPWVAQASVKRVWPDSLALDITEHVAIARWGDKQLLNQYGEIFAPKEISSAGQLPRLQGPEGSQFLVMKQYQQFSQILFPAGLKLTALVLSSRGGWQVTANETMQLAVGRNDLTGKLERFVDFYTKQPKTKVDLFEHVDLRYGNGIAVRNKSEDLSGVAVL